MELTTKQRVFVEEYLRCWNGSEAARIAGYKYPRQSAHVTLSKGYIQAVIRERLQEKAMSADEVLTHLADIARFDAGVLMGKAGVIDLEKAKEAGDTRFVKKIKWESGKLEIETYDRVEALELIGKHLAMWTERRELTGRDGGPIEVLTTVKGDVIEVIEHGGDGE